MQLDILAANASGGRLAGSVLFNGAQRRLADYRKLSCYVMQRDVLLESATVSACLGGKLLATWQNPSPLPMAAGQS